MTRSFTIESIHKTNGSRVNYTDGRFVSNTPSGAARKMFSKAYGHLKASGPMSLKIKLRETTQGSAKKEYSYKVTKVREQNEVIRNGETITYNFITKVKSI